ncbi:hypothetical protein V9T40_010183 [Parthenolecanium corni]|uniref:Uncharacterized protein n=1 Tax=Parthenolecanium corni TaxID=536013 RepID=A0AAN9TPE1_9HEMI
MSLDVNVTPGVKCGFASPMPPRPQNHQLLLKTLWHPNPGATKQKWVPQEHPIRKLGTLKADITVGRLICIISQRRNSQYLLPRNKTIFHPSPSLASINTTTPVPTSNATHSHPSQPPVRSPHPSAKKPKAISVLPCSKIHSLSVSVAFLDD